MRPHHVHDWFNSLAKRVAAWVGSPISFGIALAVIIVWAVTGPIFKFSDTWQLVINTSTTIVTFLMVFLIQNTQNRDARAIHLKLDEVIRSIEGARNELIDLEDVSDDVLDKLQAEFQDMHQTGGSGAGKVLEAIGTIKKEREKQRQ
ncbi:MAG: low affinity iron permease family protein [Fimbriimonas sp.]